MLTKRAHILFEETLWKELIRLANEKKTSVGNLVREAVEDKYAMETNLKQRRRAIEAIRRHRPAPAKGKIDYKKLINAGRKYL